VNFHNRGKQFPFVFARESTIADRVNRTIELGMFNVSPFRNQYRVY